MNHKNGIREIHDETIKSKKKTYLVVQVDK